MYKYRKENWHGEVHPLALSQLEKTGDIVKSIYTSYTVYCIPKFWYCIPKFCCVKICIIFHRPHSLFCSLFHDCTKHLRFENSFLVCRFLKFHIHYFFLDILKNRLWSKVRPKHLYLSLETTHTSFEPNPQLSNIYTRYGTQIHFFQLDRWNLDQNFVLRNEASFCGTNPHPSTNNPWNGLSFHRTELRSVERCSFPMGTE